MSSDQSAAGPRMEPREMGFYNVLVLSTSHLRMSCDWLRSFWSFLVRNILETRLDFPILCLTRLELQKKKRVWISEMEARLELLCLHYK